MFGYAMASTVVIEIVFAWPGLGREIVNAVNAYDYPVIQAAFFLISAILVLGAAFASVFLFVRW